MNLLLIGYRGTGKTTLAQLIARRLGWDWVDADVEIELRAGKSIKAIFDDDGEPRFRDLESAVVVELGQRDRTVIALGGGAPMRPENRPLLRRAGKVVWLQASPEELWQRISADHTTAGRRPNLTTSGGLTEIIATLERRSPIYRECADLEVDTEGKTPGDVADVILARLDLSPS